MTHGASAVQGKPGQSFPSTRAGKKPWLKFFVSDDWLSNPHINMLSLPAKGAAITLFCWQWHLGSLPVDDAKLARLIGCTPEDWDHLRSEVMPLFEVAGDAMGSPNIEHKWVESQSISFARSSARKGKNKRTIKPNQKHNVRGETLDVRCQTLDSEKTRSKPSREDSRGANSPSEFALTEKSPTKETDPRHTFARNLIDHHHREKFKIACTWDAAEAKQLSATLKANPAWTIEDLARMIRARFDSVGVTPDRPRLWLSNLGKYAAGPLDQYGKLQYTHGVNGIYAKPHESFQQARNRRNRELAAEVFGVADHNGSDVSEGPNASGTDEVG